MLSILYVDDDSALLDLCKIFLEADGSIRVATALSAKEALGMMQHRQYDAIISDYEMPYENGIAFLKNIRSAGNRVPFIIFTGKGREDIVIEAFNSGADFYIQKGGAPKAQFAELIHKVRTAVARKRTDRALEQSNSVLRATLEATADGILVVDSSGKITIFNNKFLQLWNIPGDITDGQDSTQLFECLAARVENSPGFTRMIAGIDALPNCESDDVCILKGGRIFRLHSQPQMTGGSVVGRVFSFQDITSENRSGMELRAAYEQIRATEEHVKQQYENLTATTALIMENEERFRSFAEVIPDGVGIFSGGILVEANDQLATLFGISVQELLGRKILDLVGPESHDQVLSQISTGSQEFSEIQMRGIDLSMIPVELSGRVIRYRGRDAWASVWRDLRERKEAEKILAESEVKYRCVFSTENNPLLLIDQATMAIREVNDAACQTYGYFRNELIGRNILDLCTEPEKVLIDIRKTRAGIQLYHHRRKDGKIFPVEVSTAFFTLNNSPVFINSVRDITHAKQIEEALKLANIKLNLLLGITRHDILNKLSVVMGYNEIISSRIPDPDLKGMLENQKKAAFAIRSQVEFTKEYEELGGKSLGWQDLEGIVSHAYDQFLKTIPITCDLGGIEVYGDPMIGKVFYNLFDNAFRYGEGIGRITISALVTPDGLTIFFEDDGIGIPVDEKEKIFCQGYGKNTGLGLFLSREILSITSMTIQETGEYRKGARFEIKVPAGFFRINHGSEKNPASVNNSRVSFSPSTV
jgi:PAS domain S-box-containing protein